MNDGEINGHMGWRGPGCYGAHSLKKLRALVKRAQDEERAEILARVMDMRMRADERVHGEICAGRETEERRYAHLAAELASLAHWVAQRGVR
jgi:hypothetical protein